MYCILFISIISKSLERELYFGSLVAQVTIEEQGTALIFLMPDSVYIAADIMKGSLFNTTELPRWIHSPGPFIFSVCRTKLEETELDARDQKWLLARVIDMCFFLVAA